MTLSEETPFAEITSAAHLLQSALRSVLGNHVEQAGSYVDDSRVRFDFRHFSPMTPEQIEKTEAFVNEAILSGTSVDNYETSIEDAKKSGAIALFGEKYGQRVRVVKMGNWSIELCGGTHVSNTAKIGLFKIISESSVAAGIRRIEGHDGAWRFDSYGRAGQFNKVLREGAESR